MRVLHIYIVIMALLISLLILVPPALCYTYYTIGQGPISDIEIDASGGNILVLSGDTVYIVSSLDGQILDDYPINGINLIDIIPSMPPDGFIYGVAGVNLTTAQYSIDRLSGEISTVSYTGSEEYAPRIQLQDSCRLYAVCTQRSWDGDALHDKVYVFNKSDLSFVEMWDCEEGPYCATYDYTDNTILVAQGVPSAIKPGAEYYTRYEPGVLYISKIGRYDPSRSGFLLDEYSVEGIVSSLVVTNNGTLIVGLCHRAGYNIPAATLAMIDNEVSYVICDDYHIVEMAYDANQNRIIALVWDENDELTGRCLVFDCTTEEYYTFESGVSGLNRFIYLDGKLYGTISDSNKLYVIEVE